jgi:DNA-binding NtrC family response regulator
MEERKIICLSRQPDECPICQAIEPAGWQIARVHDASHAALLIAGREYHVGIALIQNREDAYWFLHIEELFSRVSGMEWVAVVALDLMEQSNVRDFIAGHFLDFHTLPIHPDKLLFSLGHVWGMATLTPVTEQLYEQGNIIGADPVTQVLVRDLAKVAAVDVPVLITGETGTGKELSSKEIHASSDRHTGPFVAVNCAELPPTLIHAELFGYEKGAFTGAHRRKTGYLEQAAGGTIFLDEIGDLPIDLQMLLLRFLQQKTIRRVGGVEDIPVDARVIAATHVDLPAAVRDGRFREDLYHRLNVLRVHVPALRERNGDVDALANYFFERFSAETRRSVRGFSRAAREAMHQYHWPGNVRELMNRIRRALVMCDGRVITAHDLGIVREMETTAQGLETLEQARLRAEREAILAALQQAGGNACEAAVRLEVSRATFYRLLEKHDLTTNCWLKHSEGETQDGIEAGPEALSA